MYQIASSMFRLIVLESYFLAALPCEPENAPERINLPLERRSAILITCKLTISVPYHTTMQSQSRRKNGRSRSQ
jgi:hypothetical protein